MSEQQSAYRQIVKATSIFGGVQVFQILIQIIRSKFIAVLLGPAGMGIAGLLTSTTGLIGSLTTFGLSASAVKDIAAANSTGDQNRIAVVIAVFRKLIWITGILGAVVTLVLSPWLSQLTFGNKDYTLAFVWLSITLLFSQLSAGQLVLLQGMRKLQYLAKANLTGSILGLVITIPLYYVWGIDAIVPGIIIASITSLLRSWYFSSKIEILPVKVPLNVTIHEGKAMLTMGFLISLSSLISVGASYILRIFISNTGGVEQVGLYNAGFVIINSYVGLIFTAMGTDYYPRLAAVAHSNTLCKSTINQQAEIAILILAPILMLFLVFINWLIILMYSFKFIAINDMIYWAALGIFFKASTWAIGFIFLAKGASKVFFWSELLSNSYLLIFNIIGYKLFGLKGLGISFLISYMFSFIQVFFIAKIKFQFSFDKAFVLIFVGQFLLAILCYLTVVFISKPYAYILGSLFIVISVIYSYKELDKRLEIKTLAKSFIHRNDKI